MGKGCLCGASHTQPHRNLSPTNQPANMPITPHLPDREYLYNCYVGLGDDDDGADDKAGKGGGKADGEAARQRRRLVEFMAAAEMDVEVAEEERRRRHGAQVGGCV